MKGHLFIFAADHRHNLTTGILNINKEPNNKQLEILHDFKAMILESQQLAIKNGVNKENCFLLMDEDYGNKTLINAKKDGINIIIPVEKSGSKIFEFDYGSRFIDHIEKFKPSYVKVLIYFNPENKDDNEKTLKNLRILNNYLVNTEYKFLLEMLVEPTQEQLNKYGKKDFDIKLRPDLTIESIKEINKAGIYPNIWKLEGYSRKEDIDKVSLEVGNSKIVILGRYETMNTVLKWIKIGTMNNKVIGFAVGRTIFEDTLKKYYHKKTTREKAIRVMSSKYKKIAYFYETYSR